MLVVVLSDVYCFWICFVYYVVLVFTGTLCGEFGDLVDCGLVGLVWLCLLVLGSV